MIEVKARNIILTDRRFGLKLRRYIDKKESSISRPVKDLWEEQAKLITIKITKRALDTGKIPSDWKGGWSETIREFVRDTITTAWIKGISEAGDEVAKKVNLIQRKDFDFNTTMTSVKGWVDAHAGELIVDLTAAQMGSIHALLQAQIALGVTSPYLLAQRIRPLVGLTEREALAVVRFMATLTEEGVAAGIINKQMARYAKTLHKNRAARIARTEISNAFNFGHLDSLSQASKGGWLPGTPEKDWIAGGANPCDDCIANEAMGSIALDASFASGDQHPTAHPFCLLGETPVLAPGAAKGFASFYDGPIIKITFIGGNISVTPNHMFLTAEGFARASSIRKGDKILYSLQFEREILSNPSDNGKPSTIKQIITSLAKSGSMATCRVPVSSEYFHGDGAFMNGNIDIIAPDGFLRRDNKSIFSKFISKDFLPSSHIGGISLSGNSNLASMLFRLRDATDGSMGSRCESLTFSRRSNILPHKFSSFAFSSPLNSSSDKSSLDDRPTYSETLRNLILRFSSEISLRDVLDIQIIFPHCTLPVYDIETSSSLYIANGLVSSNCECSLGTRIRR